MAQRTGKSAAATTVSAYCGIGISTWRRNWEGAEAGVVIEHIKTRHQSPAKRAGLMNGDLLLAVRDEEGWHDVADKPTEEIPNIIRGAEGTAVTLRIKSFADGKMREVTLQRDTIIELGSWVDPNIPLDIQVQPDSHCGPLTEAPHAPLKLAMAR
jgi:C-terminal processing protease CtpA/Prc